MERQTTVTVTVTQLPPKWHCVVCSRWTTCMLPASNAFPASAVLRHMVGLSPTDDLMALYKYAYNHYYKCYCFAICLFTFANDDAAISYVQLRIANWRSVDLVLQLPPLDTLDRQMGLSSRCRVPPTQPLFIQPVRTMQRSSAVGWRPASCVVSGALLWTQASARLSAVTHRARCQQ